MKRTCQVQDRQENDALEGQAISPPGQDVFAATILSVADHLVEAANGLRELEQIRRNQLGSLRPDEQQVAAANPFRDRQEIMNSTNSASATIATRAARELFSAKDVTDLLLIDARSFRRLRNTRAERFPAPIRIGSSKRWREKEVREWLDSRRPE